MNKKLLVLLPAAMLMLASCGGGNTDPSKTDPSKTDPSTTSTTSETTSTTSETTSEEQPSETTSETTSEGETIDYGSQTDPLTVAEALEVGKEDTSVSYFNSQEEDKSDAFTKEPVWVKGLVASTTEVGTDGLSFTLRDSLDSEDSLTVYYAKPVDGLKTPYMNDEVLLHGHIEFFKNNVYEIATWKEHKPEPVVATIEARTAGTSTITVAENDYGTATLSATSALNDTEITFTVTAKEGKIVDTVSVYGKNLEAVEGVYKFALAGNATITMTGHDEGGVAAEVEEVDFSKQGYENQKEITEYKGTNFTVTFDKGDNSNAPKYYTSGAAIRVYAKNSFTVTAGKIVQIVITFGGSDGNNEITVDAGALEGATWTGEAASVKFTVGGTSGNRRLAKLAVSYIPEN